MRPPKGTQGKTVGHHEGSAGIDQENRHLQNQGRFGGRKKAPRSGQAG